ncbi:MAG: IS3 family transposase [Mycoplasmatales bacterium]
MSAPGCPYDNAVSENIFNLFKKKLEYSKDDDVLSFQNKVKKYVDWYNNVRIQKRLNNMSPVQFRFSM